MMADTSSRKMLEGSKEEVGELRVVAAVVGDSRRAGEVRQGLVAAVRQEGVVGFVGDREEEVGPGFLAGEGVNKDLIYAEHFLARFNL